MTPIFVDRDAQAPCPPPLIFHMHLVFTLQKSLCCLPKVHAKFLPQYLCRSVWHTCSS